MGRQGNDSPIPGLPGRGKGEPFPYKGYCLP